VSENQGRGSALRFSGLLSGWIGGASILLSITLCTYSFAGTLAVSTGRFYHSAGELGRQARQLHTAYEIAFFFFLAFSALLIFARKIRNRKDSIGYLLVVSAALSFLGFVGELSLLTVVATVLWRLRR
jgi:hypothetical protein